MTTMTQTANKVFRVAAHNTAPDSENKIHDDRVAQAYGFRGGLVPGVTVYGYMIPPVLERLGRAWLEHGGMNPRLFAPCYPGEKVPVRCDGSTVAPERQAAAPYPSRFVYRD